MVTLRQLDEELDAVQRIMNEPNIDTESMQQGLDGLNVEREAKLKNCGFVILDLQSQLHAIETEVERLEHLAAARRSKLDWLKGYVRDSMVAHGDKEVHDPLISLRIRTGPPSVIVTDEAKLPRQYWREYKAPPPSVNRQLLRQDLKAGEVPGAELAEGKPFLKVT